MSQRLHFFKISLPVKSEGAWTKPHKHPDFILKAACIGLFITLFLNAPSLLSQKLPEYIGNTGGTQITNTNGQWVTVNPASPGNSDILESQIFKMPQKGTGVVGIEFKVVGADGGTARYLWGANNQFSKGGGGGQIQFTMDLSKKIWLGFQYPYETQMYGQPFFVTFGKKGESKQISKGYYVSAGGGGSTGMSWIVGGASHTDLNDRYLIAAAGGGGGGYSYVYGTLNGNSATRNAKTDPGSISSSKNIAFLTYGYDEKVGEADLSIVSGSGDLVDGGFIQATCCTTNSKVYFAMSLVHYRLEWSSNYSSSHITHGQGGGQPVAVFAATEGEPNYTGLGIRSKAYEVYQLGGKGGAGFGGGGAGSSTTSATDMASTETKIPTGGAGGTGSIIRSGVARTFPNNSEGGFNNYTAEFANNVSISSRTPTDNPQSGYMMYRTISDTEKPQINISNITVYLRDGNTPLGYYSDVSLSQAFQQYMMKTDGLWDNDGIASVTATVSGQPFTKFDCSVARQDVPVQLTVTDVAGNATTQLVMVKVIDPFKPVSMDVSASSQINVNDGPVTLTAASFPQAYDGCNGSNVTITFPATTFYCNDVGSHPIQYYYTDRDGNNSQVYTKTFNIVCSTANTGTGENGTTNWRYLYVDLAASGTKDGSSWANAFTNLQDALNYPYSATIYVAKGTYYPTSTTDRAVSFVLKNNTQVYGGFPSGGSSSSARNPEANPTILSGKINSTDNSYHVVTIAGNNTRLEGFTIRDGKADKNSTDGGGGLLLSQAATNLGTDHNTTIRNCKLISNYGTYGGAAFFEYKNQTNSNNLDIENCAFNDNSTYYSGGAVFLRNPSATDNMYAKFVNALFSGNTANAGGGAVALDSYASAEMTNCTFSGNHAVSNGGALFSNGKVKLHNSILYFNTSTNNPQTGEIYRNGGSAIQVDYSNIQGSGGSSNWTMSSNGISDSGNNIDADPLFNASPALSISSESPCYNAGKNEYNSEPYDIYGKNYRIQGVIDMGVFEATGNVVYVAADAPNGGDGLSWATAFNNLNAGISAAGIGANQKDVWVKAGTYRPDRLPGSNTVTTNNRENSFYVSFALKIYGGFAGNETSTAQRNIGQNPTILSGDIGTLNNTSDNAYHVITMMAGDARLDGLIIEEGNANDAGNGDNRNGGGIYERVQLGNGKNIIANCVFRNNQAQEAGGAWFAAAAQTSTTDFVQTLFYNNKASRGAVSYVVMSLPYAASYDQNFYNLTAFGNTSSASGSAAFEANELTGNPARFNFYNSVLAGNAPQNYNDSGNAGRIALTNTVNAASGTDVFADTFNPAGADGKIMTADDGLQPGIYSPAISYGDSSLLYNYNGKDRDIAGSPRIVNQLDAGAYESSYNAPLTADGQGIIYVRPIASGEKTGSSWENATSDLHNAIHAPGVKKVFVAIGTYKVGDHSFIMKNGVELYGGFDPANGITNLSHKRIMPNPYNIYGLFEGSILDGQLVRPVIWNIFTAGTAMNNTAVLDGFLLQNGKHPTGGGVRNIYASPTLRNIVMTSNRATVAGAGMYNENSSPVLTNVLICQNRIDTRLISEEDRVPVYGAGIYNTTNSNPVLTNMTIGENLLLTAGEAMQGAGIYNYNSSPVIRNSIFFNNAKSYSTTTAGADIQDEGSSVTSIKNSITQSYDTGNPADNLKVGVNPNFVNFGAKNFRLAVGSPAIDAGDNALFTGLNADSKDIDGNPRVFDAENGKNIDMGAYEYQCLPVDYSTATMEDITIDYDGNPHSITAGNLVEGVSASYEITDADNNTTTGNTATNAGTYTITATILPTVSGVDCEPVIKIGVLTINKMQSVITADEIQSHIYDGTQKNVIASLNHTESALSYVPQQGYTDAGVYPVTVVVPETANYFGASKTVNLAIENADFAGIALNDASFTYDGSPKSLEIAGALPVGAEALYSGNGKTDVGTYTVGALVQLPNYNDLWLTATMTINSALPVRWISFDGKLDDSNYAKLDWKVDQTSVAGYQIERSNNAKDFRIVGSVVSATGDGISQYSFTDPTAAVGTVYYRIRQTDLDGSHSYSRIISLAGPEGVQLMAYPNPTGGKVTVQVSPEYLGTWLKLINSSGILVKQVELKGQTLEISLDNYPAGTYILYTWDGKAVKLIKN